jgi:hypothetical protein
MVFQIVLINMTNDVKQELSVKVNYLFHGILISINFKDIKLAFYCICVSIFMSSLTFKNRASYI